MSLRIIALSAAALLAGCAERQEPDAKYAPASRALEEGERRTVTPTGPSSSVDPPSSTFSRPAQSRLAAAPSPQDPPIESNILAISRARCERAQRCDNVGAGKRFPTLEACVDTVKQVDVATYGPAGCVVGIDRIKLQGCLHAIAEADCSTEFDTLDELTACQHTRVCRD